VPKDEEDKVPKTFPGLLTIKEEVATEGVIDMELKHLFKGKSGWTIKMIDANTYLLDFSFVELRDELTKFKGFEFATTYIKAKLEPTELEKRCCRHS
jgi:hypothetical protein